jgi:hypothetical protein
MPKRQNEKEPDEIGRAHPGSERARDEQREDGGPRYGGEAWEVADERGDRRFGVARNDDADPSELSKGTHAVDDDEWPNSDATGASNEAAGARDNGETESGGQHAGMRRGDKPQKPKARAKPNPRAGKHKSGR